MKFRLLMLLCLTLAACANSGSRPGGAYVGGNTPIECAPFARALTTVSLSGAAADWWDMAAGHYVRSHHPAVGSVLVFRRSGRLPSGHVAVVSQVLSQRRIMVIQANWVHHRVTRDQPVIDVSKSGDWSAVRVWWPPSRQVGLAEYSTFGFIRPRHPVERDRLVAAIPAAIRTVEQGW